MATVLSGDSDARPFSTLGVQYLIGTICMPSASRHFKHLHIGRHFVVVRISLSENMTTPDAQVGNQPAPLLCQNLTLKFARTVRPGPGTLIAFNAST